MSSSETDLVRPRYDRRLFLLGAFAALLGAACVRTRAPSIPVESKAPAFSLLDATGKRVSLADLTQRGPALVVFYRGHW